MGRWVTGRREGAGGGGDGKTGSSWMGRGVTGKGKGASLLGGGEKEE